MRFKDYPADVQEIIEYTKLKKKYPKLDQKLRSDLDFGNEITIGQMLILLRALREKNEK